MVLCFTFLIFHYIYLPKGDEKMPKLKTRKCVKKRMRVTKSGKIKHFKAGKGHLLTSKRSKRKRGLRRPGLVSHGDLRAMKDLLPYGA
jgi:large subunit ribosomal protein L35